MFSFKSRSSAFVNSVKSSSKVNRVSDFHSTEASDMQQQLNQLQEELRKEKEAKVCALDEIDQFKKKNKNKNKLKNNEGEVPLELARRLEQLEGELGAARDAEKKMLASLEAQTKQLEQTKASLEEAKLEIASLQENNKSLEAFTALSSSPSRQQVKNLRRGMMSFSIANHGEVEARSLQHELKLALESEEKCKKAMDDLAIALKEQSTEAREANAKLSMVQAELTNAKAEVEQAKASLESKEEKLQLALEQRGRLKFELDELAAASMEKERGLIDCIKLFEGELNKAKEENDKIFESQRMIRDENSRVREMLKHAVSEATVVKESLEIARRENSQLKDHLSDKESTLQSIRQEYESLKVSEAAAQSSIKELKDLMDGMFSSESTKTSAEASPRDAKEGKVKARPITADDEYSDVERAPCLQDVGSPARQKKKTILRKFSEIMKKRNSQNAV